MKGQSSERPGILSDGDFEAVIHYAPLVSIDLVVRLKDRFLLGRRDNQPAKGDLFVLGGRIWKDETTENAFRFITETELGVAKKLSDAVFLGVFTHLYPTNFFEKAGFGTHYVALAYVLTLESMPNLPKIQHNQYVWWTAEQIRASSEVNSYTKTYFELETIRSENQYKEISTRRNTSNILLWQTPALSLTALAFLLNVAGSKNNFPEIRIVTCLLGLAVATVTLQLFVRHRAFENRESKLLGDFERRNRHLGYAPINSPIDSSNRSTDCWLLSFLSGFKSHKWWVILFICFFLASFYLLWFNGCNPKARSETPKTVTASTNMPAQLSAVPIEPALPELTSKPAVESSTNQLLSIETQAPDHPVAAAANNTEAAIPKTNATPVKSDETTNMPPFK